MHRIGIWKPKIDEVASHMALQLQKTRAIKLNRSWKVEVVKSAWIKHCLYLKNEQKVYKFILNVVHNLKMLIHAPPHGFSCLTYYQF